MADEAHEQPEIRDSDELNEEALRAMMGLFRNLIEGAKVPIGENGRPMAMIFMGVSDKVPSVQYGNVIVGPVMAMRYIDDLGDGIEGRQHRIDLGRELLKDMEFVCGIERRLVQWAINPADRVASPIQPGEEFAAPSPGYDPNRVTDLRPETPAPTPQAVEQQAGQPVPVAPPTAPAQPAGEPKPLKDIVGEHAATKVQLG